MCVAASVLYFCNLTQKEKKRSSVHTAKWRTDPVCCTILRLLFALTGVQHACPPLLDSVRVTHVRLPPARRRPAALQLQGTAGRAWRSLLPWTAPGVSVASSQVLQLYDKNRRPNVLRDGRPPRQLLDSRTVTASPATCSRRPASPFGFYFCFRDAEDPGRWRMRRVALPARMRTSCRSAVAELTDAFRWCRGRRSAEGRESNSVCSLQKC